MLGVVLRREWHAFFRTPWAWGVLALLQGLLAYQFLALIEQFDAAAPRLARLPQPPGLSELVVQPLMMMLAMLLLFVVPMLSMQSFAGERRNGTLCLWLAAPVPLVTLVLGKWLGVLSVLLVIWASAAAMCLSLALGSTPDPGAVASALLGLLLFMAMAAALGVLFSSLTQQPALAALGCFASLMFLWTCDWSGQLEDEATLFTQWSLMNHYQRLARGLVDTGDLLWFALLTAAALALATWRLAGERRGY